MWGPNAPYFGFGRGFWILDFGSWGFRILDFGDFGFWTLGILDFGDFGDFGFWIFGTLCSRSLCAKFGFWILGILDFGDFWSLGDWGFWICHFRQNFGCYIRKEDCARRPGSADLQWRRQHVASRMRQAGFVKCWFRLQNEAKTRWGGLHKFCWMWISSVVLWCFVTCRASKRKGRTETKQRS